jgi:hypothetical protein
MDNTNQPRIGCYLGNKEGSRTKIIDPNTFYGEKDSSRNIPVRLEDLTISVKLTTTKKSRTTIFSDSENKDIQVKEQKGAVINFIEGSDVNGKKVLTTKFTQLTTVFEGETLNSETFGITNIDIDFNSSYTPMIKIDFVDVRGSSIFQNEEALLNSNTENKYAIFFEFPYPLFELEIKGYFGEPVTYCLHMLKFNSKFNSQTGNFEISCEFVGYTYALLSDMLIGVLKAIPFTTIGKEKFDAYNTERAAKGLKPILNLVQLRTQISLISDTIKKIAKTTEEAKEINTFKDANNILDSLKVEYLSLNDEFSVSKKPSTTEPPQPSFVVISGNTISTTKENIKKGINENILKNVKDFNALKIQGLTINQDNMTVPTLLTNLKLKMLEPEYELAPFGTLKTPEDVASFKSGLKSYVNNYIGLSPDMEFSVYDLRSRLTIIDNKRDLVQKTLDDANKSLAIRIKDTVSDTLGFEPTVRNMVEIFTALIEIFIETIYEVSNKAEKNVKRSEVLGNVFSNGNNQTDYVSKDNFYPWPAYSEASDSLAYVDTYLGSNSEVKRNISDIDELVFIDNLLLAFLTANKEENKAQLENDGQKTLYIPCNPLDTNVFSNSGNPYGKKEIISQNQALRLLLIRAMTFLGYTNNQDYLTKGEDGEIQKMAALEAQMLFEGLTNSTIKILFNNLTPDEAGINKILTAYGKISGTDRDVVEKTNLGNYYYNYITKDNVNNVKLLPVGYDIDGEDITILTDETAHPIQTGMIDFSKNPTPKLFLTNYSPYYAGSGISPDNFKYDDGGVYIKILKPIEYEPTEESTLFDTTITNDSALDLASLETNTISSAGFNSFNGPYGIQDFNNINFGEGVSENITSMYVFYSNNIKLNGLSLVRPDKVSSKWDFKKVGLNLYGFTNTETQLSPFYSNGKTLHEKLGNNRTLGFKTNEVPPNVSYPYINYQLDSSGSYSTAIIQYLPLFGSKFYYIQKDSVITRQNNTTITNIAEYYVKGLLFLNTLPFNIDYSENEDPFNKPEIKHLFDIKGGFIHAPRLWVAYVGGLLWWLSEKQPKIENNQIIGGGRGKNDPIIWKHRCGGSDSLFTAPESNQYLPKNLMGDRNDIDENSPLITMPEQAKEEFKKVFFDFINGTGETDFKQLAKQLEIFDGTALGFCSILDKLTKYETAADPTGLIIARDSKSWYEGSSITDNLKNYDNYNIILPVDERQTQNIKLNYFFLELNGAKNITKNLLNLFSEELIIANTGVKIWQSPGYGIEANPLNNTDIRVGVTVKKEIFEEYMKKFIDTIKELTKDVTKAGEEEKQINEVFGSTNKDDIKLMLYKHCKNIYDKWLGGVDDPKNVIFQCGDNARNDSNRKTVDTKLANKNNTTGTVERPRLIDSFRFVTRSFRDIGDELFVNPTSIEEQITDFPNTPAYSVITGLLNDNKFEFTALPTFINYRNDDMLKSVFTPYQYTKSITSCGPTFVCVYTGQRSNRLDIKSGRYPNDGFDMRCIDGKPDSSIPADFSSPLNDYEDPISVFEVNYSQQNQNIFKDITLDQSEFTESEESLKIVQDISMNGFENKPSLAGQNMYNIYAVRSYSAEIEMLGNPMIQPMMYFQLNNIPMFHGAYMIIRTRHNIKPNHMTTWFTGTRIRAIESPIIDVADAYMNLIETLDLGDTKSTSTVVSGSFPPIVRTIIDNGGSNGNVEVGNIKLVPVEQITDVEQDVPPERRKMITEAVPALTEMLTEFAKFAKAEGYPTINKKYVGITSLYRSYEYQQELYDKNIKKGGKQGAVAEPGFSNHSWGIAVDLLFAPQKSGTYLKVGEWAPIDTDANKEGFSFEYNPSLKWFLDNSWKFGFIIPVTLRDGKGNVDEYWHFEYHGTSAKCLYNKLPSTYGYTPKLNTGYKSVVKNPKGIDGKEAIYLENECDFKYVSTGDGGANLSTKTSNQTIINNQIEVKNNLKNRGLTQTQVAGIMGNIHKETGGRFDPKIVNKQDTNGYPSVGLIQWNGKFYPSKNAGKNSNDVLSYIGKTITEQLNFLTTKTPGYTKWLNLDSKFKTKTSAYSAAYEFARLVEICAGCIEGEQVYNNNKFDSSDRSKLANNYYARFNTQGDVLFW